MLEGFKPADVETPGGESLRTLWTPQLVTTAWKTRRVSNPLVFLAQLVERTEGAGAAAAEAGAGAVSPGPVAGAQELPPGSPPGEGSGSGPCSCSGPGSPTDSESGLSTDSRRDSWAESEESGSESEDGVGTASRPIDVDKGKSKGKGEGRGKEMGEGKGKGKVKGDNIVADGGTRATPARNDVAEEGRSDPEEEGAGSVSTDGPGTYKRKRPEGGASSDGSTSTGESRKRCRQLPSSSGEPAEEPAAVATEARVAPESLPLITPFVRGWSDEQLDSPFDWSSVRFFVFALRVAWINAFIF